MREIVIISGPPAADKTTLAVPLARALGFPLLSKDVIKEALADSLPAIERDDLTWSRQVGSAAMELLWRLAENCPAAVLEANFRTRSVQERDRLLGLSAHLVEVFCRVPTAVAVQRYGDRHAARGRHRVHVLPEVTADSVEQFQHPFALGPVLEVDTTQPVQLDDLAERVAAELRLPQVAPG